MNRIDDLTTARKILLDIGMSEPEVLQLIALILGEECRVCAGCDRPFITGQAVGGRRRDSVFCSIPCRTKYNNMPDVRGFRSQRRKAMLTNSPIPDGGEN